MTRAVRAYGAVDFFNTLAGPFGRLTDALSPDHPERLYPPTVTQSMFLSQALHADRSCQRLVNEWAAMRWRWRWQGHCVKLIDDTGISMPDTPLNQACYPQLSSRAAGVGFPLARLAGRVPGR